MRVQPFSYIKGITGVQPTPPADVFLYLGASDFSTLDDVSANNGLVKFDDTGAKITEFAPTVTYNTVLWAEYIQGNVIYVTSSDVTVINGTTGAYISNSSLSGNNVFNVLTYGDYVYFTGNDMGTYQGSSVGRMFRIDKDGVLDTTFLSNRPNFNNYVQPITYVDDDIIIVAGSFTSATTGYDYFQVLNTTDGTINTNFMNGRAATGDFNGAVNGGTKVGNIIVAIGNNFSSVGGTSYPRIIAFNLDGSPNTTFNSGTTGTTGVPRFIHPIDSTTFIIFFGGATFNFNGSSIPAGVCVVNTDGTTNSTITNYFGTGFNALPRYFITDSNGYYWISGEGFTSLNGTTYNNIVQIDLNTGTVNPTYNYVSGMKDNGGNPMSTFRSSLFKTR